MSVKINKIVLPGDSITLDTTLPNQTVLIEGWNACHWPEPQITEVNDGKIQVINTSNNPVILRENRVNSIKLTSTNNTDWKPFRLSAIATQSKKSLLLHCQTTRRWIRLTSARHPPKSETCWTQLTDDSGRCSITI